MTSLHISSTSILQARKIISKCPIIEGLNAEMSRRDTNLDLQDHLKPIAQQENEKYNFNTPGSILIVS